MAFWDKIILFEIILKKDYHILIKKQQIRLFSEKKTFKTTLYTESYCFQRGTCIKPLAFWSNQRLSIILTLSFVPQRLTLIYKGDSLLYFLNAFQKCYILTEFFLAFLCFSYFWIKTKYQFRLLALGFEPRHTSRCLHIITWGCSANWTILTCQNLSFLRKVSKIWNETQLVSFSLLYGFALTKGPPLYIKFVILPTS